MFCFLNGKGKIILEIGNLQRRMITEPDLGLFLPHEVFWDSIPGSIPATSHQFATTLEIIKTPMRVFVNVALFKLYKSTQPQHRWPFCQKRHLPSQGKSHEEVNHCPTIILIPPSHIPDQPYIRSLPENTFTMYNVKLQV